MLRYASSKGLSVSSILVRDFAKISNHKGSLGKLKNKQKNFLSAEDLDFSEMDMANLTNIHSELSRTVAPATPFTLLFLQTDAENSFGSFRVFGSVPLLRRLLLMAIFCLLAMLSYAFIPDAPAIIGNPLLSNEGVNLVLAVVFRLAAAGMGASFFALYKAKGYVANKTFDPDYEGTYWTEFFLGLLAGLIFSTLLDGQSSAVGESLNAVSSGSEGTMLGKIVLALLGGFSSTVVYEFLNKTVQALASIFKADPKKVIDSEVRNIRANIENSFAKKRQTVLSHLSELQSDIFTGDFSKEGMSERVRNLMDDLTDGDDQGYYPQDDKPRERPKIPEHIPSAADINVEDIDPRSVSHIHQDDLLEADEQEYIDIFDTRA